MLPRKGIDYIENEAAIAIATVHSASRIRSRLAIGRSRLHLAPARQENSEHKGVDRLHGSGGGPSSSLRLICQSGRPKIEIKLVKGVVTARQFRGDNRTFAKITLWEFGFVSRRSLYW
jgi:hypothetical protein